MRQIDEEVLARLRATAQNASVMNWSPYTGFTVLAAVRTTEDEYHGGSNVENANLSLSKHAEETAIIRALAAGALGGAGHRSRRCIDVLYTTSTPCGGCRQFLSEFATEDCVVYVEDIEPAIHLLGDLLPVAFGPERHGVDEAGSQRPRRGGHDRPSRAISS
jgi:cytidine deaminase